ncbi:MBL fold metallo-hydrolase [Haladaptatus sp. F3-133]|jgi:hydroxyacylglutathione hydrolase|uniref:MBL fold metallo-hydrolase n=1 Tax=Halorutilus salinus TaxID=2487751 RepID=A0A9Q4C4H3_9EURY|nr:MBL fold metallo-hydrolase [Halorutilus salinus]MCX2818789.1 MBL fold metallo-hydrolase [Halorutilus salinus]
MRVTNLAEGSTEFTSNAFLVEPDVEGRSVLVDVGSDDTVLERLRDRGGIDTVVLTHTHGDHVGILDEVRDGFGVGTWGYDASSRYVDNPLAEGDTFEMGGAGFTVWHTPGHKGDHICLYSPETGVLFAGDLVFAGGSFGRTDLDEGDRATLVGSTEKVLENADGIDELHTGHGPSVYENARKHVEASLRNARGR